MVVIVYSAWHQSVMAATPYNQAEIYPSEMTQTHMANYWHLPHTETEKISHDLTEQDTEYAVNLAKYMVEKDTFVPSKL